MPTKPPPGSTLKGGKSRRGDTIFHSIAIAAGAMIIAAIALMALFLIVRAIPSLAADQVNFITSTEFNTTDAGNLRFGIRDLFMVTVLSSIFALVIAVPIAIGIATFLTNYAPRRVAKPFASMVDLLAAVPSIVYGLWGIFVLAPWLAPVARFLNDNLGWFFLFADGNVSLAGGGTIFTAGIVLAVMILPIITSVTREVFSLTPKGHIEAAQALGATKWEVVRMTVFPYGRSGMIAASMLGLGRALGETIAILDHPADRRTVWALVAVRRRIHLRVQDRLGRRGVQLTAAHRRLYCGRVHSLCPDVHRQRACSSSSRRKGQRRMTQTSRLPRSRHRPSTRSVSRAS